MASQEIDRQVKALEHLADSADRARAALAELNTTLRLLGEAHVEDWRSHNPTQ